MNKAKPKSIKFYDDTGEWGFISTMYLCPIEIGGVLYKSLEHYYQSTKPLSESKRKWIMDSATGYEAKARLHSLGPEEYPKRPPEEKLTVMRRGFTAKFAQNPDLGEKLLATGDAILLEDSPDDLFWGARGENWMGKLAMEAREALRRLSPSP